VEGKEGSADRKRVKSAANLRGKKGSLFLPNPVQKKKWQKHKKEGEDLTSLQEKGGCTLGVGKKKEKGEVPIENPVVQRGGRGALSTL